MKRSTSAIASKRPRVHTQLAARAVVESLPQSKLLTLRERERVAGVLSGERRSDAPTITKSPLLREALIAAIEKTGVGVEYLASHMKGGLEASVPGEHGERGDWASRHKYFSTLLGMMLPPTGEGGGNRESSKYRSMLHGEGEIIDVTPPKSSVVQRRMAAQKPQNRGNK